MKYLLFYTFLQDLFEPSFDLMANKINACIEQWPSVWRVVRLGNVLCISRDLVCYQKWSLLLWWLIGNIGSRHNAVFLPSYDK